MTATKRVNLLLCVQPEFSTYETAHAAKISDQFVSLFENSSVADANIDVIAFLGNLTANATGDDFNQMALAVDKIWEQCIRKNTDLLSVSAAPGCKDRQVLPSTQQSIRKIMTQQWPEVEDDFWQGAWQDIRSSTVKSFDQFSQWLSVFTDNNRNNEPICLPGDAVQTVNKAGTRFAIVSLNSAFRMIDRSEDPALATVSPKHLDSVVGSNFENWCNSFDAVIILSAYSVPLQLNCKTPVLAIASHVYKNLQQKNTIKWFDASKHTRRDKPLLASIDVNNVGTAQLIAEDGRILAESTNGRATHQASRQHPRQPLDQVAQSANSGQLILVLTSGLEHTALNNDGEPLSSLDSLCINLQENMNGSVSGEANSPTIAEILNRAYREIRPEAHRIAKKSLLGVSLQEDNAVSALLELPWLRIYDFTGNNILTMALEGNTLVRTRATVVNTASAYPSVDSPKLEIASMNGIADWRNAPKQFLPDQPGAKKAWLRQFRADMYTYPAVFISDSLDGRTLWQCLEQIDVSSTQRSTPPRFVVAVNGDSISEWRLSSYNATYIEMPVTAFAKKLIESNGPSITEGARRLSIRRTYANNGTGLLLVSGLLANARAGSKNFLRGFDASWGDIKDQVPARLSGIDKIFQADADADAGHPILILSERAGSGKTTALMQFATEAENNGQMVGWVDRQTTHSVKDLEEEIRELKPEIVVIDDVDIFGSRAPDFLKRLNARGGRLVVASVRSTQQDFAGDLSQFQRIAGLGILTDDDLGKLVHKLADHGLLGILKNLRIDEARVAELRRISERDLLAAMVQVVTGTRFDERIWSEYQQLSVDYQTVYAALCIFNSVQYETTSIPEDGLLQVLSSMMHESRTAEIVQDLTQRNLIIRDDQHRLRARHRAIADKVVSALRTDPKMLANVLSCLLSYYASRKRYGSNFADPQLRTLQRMLNHQRMGDLGLPAASVREIYDSVRVWCDDDLHYWLQRGSYELESGDVELAWSYLESARGCEGGVGDHMVTTAWGACRLLRATKDPEDSKLQEYAKEAISNLERVALTKGKHSPQTFSVIVRYETEWLKVCNISQRARADLSKVLLDIIERGRRVVGNNSEFKHQVRIYEPILKEYSTTSERGFPL